jgi:hypothetical protein
MNDVALQKLEDEVGGRASNSDIWTEFVYAVYRQLPSLVADAIKRSMSENDDNSALITWAESNPEPNWS